MKTFMDMAQEESNQDLEELQPYRPLRGLEEQEYLMRVGYIIKNAKVPDTPIALVCTAGKSMGIVMPTAMIDPESKQRRVKAADYVTLIGALIAVKAPLHLMQYLDALTRDSKNQSLLEYNDTKENIIKLIKQAHKNVDEFKLPVGMITKTPAKETTELPW